MNQSFVTVSILYFLLIKTSTAQITSGIIEYNQEILEQEPNVHSSNQYDNLYASFLNELRENSRNIIYTLKFNSNEASFSANKLLETDLQSQSFHLALSHAKGNGKRYYDIENKIGLWAIREFDKNIIVQDTAAYRGWNILNESKIIGNYRVLKATKDEHLENGKKIEVVAWFTPELPYSFGPNGYNALPGAILEIQRFNYKISAISITLNSSVIKIEKPSKGEVMSVSEYEKKLREYASNFSFQN